MKSADEMEKEGVPRYQRCQGCRHRNLFHAGPQKDGLNTGHCDYDADDVTCSCDRFISKQVTWEDVVAERRQRLTLIMATLETDLRAAGLPDTARIAEDLAESYTEEVFRQKNERADDNE